MYNANANTKVGRRTKASHRWVSCMWRHIKSILQVILATAMFVPLTRSGMVLKFNELSCSFFFSPYHITTEWQECMHTHARAHTPPHPHGGNLNFLCSKLKVKACFVVFYIPRHAKGKPSGRANRARMGTYRVAQTLFRVSFLYSAVCRKTLKLLYFRNTS